MLFKLIFSKSKSDNNFKHIYYSYKKIIAGYANLIVSDANLKNNVFGYRLKRVWEC